MIGLRSVQNTLNDSEEFDREQERNVQVVTENAFASALVTGEEYGIMGNDKVFLTIMDKLKAHGTKDGSGSLQTKVKLGAELELSGQDAEAVTSAVRTTSFLFEQLLIDLDLLSRKNGMGDHSVEKNASIRNQLVRSFHDHMTKVLEDQQGHKGLEDEFGSVEGILAHGAEAYIAKIREVIKNDFEDAVNVWYRDLNYEAHIPESLGVNRSQHFETIASSCFNMTLGKVIGSVKRLFGCCLENSNTVGVSDYQRLDDGIVENGVRIKPVLKNLTGLIRHSRLTLVLGPPGCGKTSFLKAVSGKLHAQKGVHAKISGELRYNHFLVEQLKILANWATYVGQNDEHLPLLTVRETLDFAWKCRKSARRKSDGLYKVMCARLGQEATDRIRALTDVEVDFVLAVLGLTICADTIIGNAMLKGVSGGEKRRVTLGEMLVTGAQILCLDEISTGLDSAATFDICRYLQATAHFLGEVVVVALLQPPPEVIELFDDIILLAKGHVIYHGPRTDIKQYFKRLGYNCPERKDLGDYLQELPTRTGQGFMMSAIEREAIGAPAQPPRTPHEFALAWKHSQEGVEMEDAVTQEAQHHFEKEEQILHADSDMPFAHLTWDDMPENSFFTELGIVLAWSWKLRLRNKAQVFARVFQNFFMGCIFGTLFWQVGESEWYLKAMLFAQMPGFMQAGAIGAVSQLVQERGVFYKQSSAKFYSATTFAFCQFLVQVPFSVFDAMVFGNLLYFMCGLVLEPYRYATFMSLGILFGLCINQMMRVFAYSVQNQSSALVCAVLAYLLFLIFSGQIATPEVIPWYLQWFFWINPLAWVYRALAINEFKSAKYGGPGVNTCNVTSPLGSITVNERCGDFYLKNRQFETDEAFVVYAFYVLIGYLIFFVIVSIFALKYVRFDRQYTESEQEEEEEETEETKRVDIPLKRVESLVTDLKTLVFTDLWYTISLGPSTDHEGNTVDLLKGVSGWACPGRMTALMGSSGAGKTTLLDVLATRKTTGTVRGNILVNRVQPERSLFKRYVGYVEQFGVHSNEATVLESLRFSAGLRLPAESRGRLDDFVRETMELLELTQIGAEICKSLSVEENKRLTIAVELVANPSILFADEPTSGLDARAAAIVMRSIQNVARTGRTVICTIHQPSIAVFSMFDDLLLMKRGGEVVYFGELGNDAENLISYFQGIPGTPPCPDGYNPATWMLEVIGAGTTQNTVDTEQADYGAIYRRSKLYQQNRQRLREEFSAPVQDIARTNSFSGATSAMVGGSSSFAPAPGKDRVIQSDDEDFGGATTTKQPFVKQLWYILVRNLRVYWRSPEFSLSRLMVIFLVGTILAVTFFQQKYSTAADIQSRISAVSFIVFLSGAYNMFTIIPFTIQRRALYYREVASGMYSALAAVTGDGLVEFPYLVLETVIGVNVVYWGIGFQDETFPYLYYNAMFFGYILLMTSLGMFVAALMPDALSAQLTATVFIQIFQLFAGIIVPYNKLKVYFRFLYFFSPQMWATEGLITTQFHNDLTPICNPHGERILKTKFCSERGNPADLETKNFTGFVISAQDYVYAGDGAFLKGYDYEHVYNDLGVVFLWILGLRILTCIVVVFVDHNKR